VVFNCREGVRPASLDSPGGETQNDSSSLSVPASGVSPPAVAVAVPADRLRPDQVVDGLARVLGLLVLLFVLFEDTEYLLEALGATREVDLVVAVLLDQLRRRGGVVVGLQLLVEGSEFDPLLAAVVAL